MPWTFPSFGPSLEHPTNGPTVKSRHNNMGRYLDFIFSPQKNRVKKSIIIIPIAS
jgi:hypothetical protein